MPTSAFAAARVALAVGAVAAFAVAFLPPPDDFAGPAAWGPAASLVAETRPSAALAPTAVADTPSRLETLIASAAADASPPDPDPPTGPFFDQASVAELDPYGDGRDVGPAPSGRTFPLNRVAGLGLGQGPLIRPGPSVPLEDETFFPEAGPGPVAAVPRPAATTALRPSFPPAVPPDPAPVPDRVIEDLAELRTSVAEIAALQRLRSDELRRMRRELLAVSREAIALATVPTPPVGGRPAEVLHAPAPSIPPEWIVEVLPRVFGPPLEGTTEPAVTEPVEAGLPPFPFALPEERP